MQHVLLIEDDRGDAELILDRLTHLGHDATWKVDLAEGVKALGDEAFDVVLLDLSLPDSHGVESVATAFFFDAETPIIVLTGNDDHRVATQAIAAGAHAVLIKGETTDDSLEEALRGAAIRFQAQQQLGVHQIGRGRISTVALPAGAAFLAAMAEHLRAIHPATVLYVATQRPARVVREALPGAHFIDATGATDQDGHIFSMDDADDLSLLALEMERACAALGPDTRVVIDNAQSLILRHGHDAAIKWLRLLFSRMRLLGLRVELLAHDDAQWPFIADHLGEFLT